MDRRMAGFPVFHYLLKFAQTHIHWVSDAIQASHTLSLPYPLALKSFPASGSFPMSQFFASGGQSIGDSASSSALIEYSGLISFRIDWLDLLTIQGTLKSLLQHPSVKASVLWCSVFFMVQLSHLYMTTGKTTVLTIRAFVSKMMSLAGSDIISKSQSCWIQM